MIIYNEIPEFIQQLKQLHQPQSEVQQQFAST
jgi:hypothetical protein